MFKNMEVVFKVVNDTAFNEGRFGRNRTNWVFTVKRYMSGAFAYGDLSAHSIEFDYEDGRRGDGRYYDTRYDGINTNKDEWITFWKNFIESDYQFEMEVVSFKEEMVE